MNSIIQYLVNKIHNCLFRYGQSLYLNHFEHPSAMTMMVMPKVLYYIQMFLLIWFFPPPPHVASATVMILTGKYCASCLREQSTKSRKKQHDAEQDWRPTLSDPDVQNFFFISCEKLSIPSSLKSIIACIITGNRHSINVTAQLNVHTTFPQQVFPITISPTQPRSTDNFFLCNYTYINGGYCGGEQQLRIWWLQGESSAAEGKQWVGGQAWVAIV